MLLSLQLIFFFKGFEIVASKITFFFTIRVDKIVIILIFFNV